MEPSGAIFFGTNVIQGTWSGRQETIEEATRQGGTPTPLGAPSCLMDASLRLRLHLQVFWFAFGPRKIIAKVSFHLDSVWYSFSAKL